jgi:hypothetical protein
VFVLSIYQGVVKFTLGGSNQILLKGFSVVFIAPFIGLAKKTNLRMNSGFILLLAVKFTLKQLHIRRANALKN